jgi:hypothetical protein
MARRIRHLALTPHMGGARRRIGHAGAGRVKSSIMACYSLERWIEIAIRASSCHDYAVCSNSWQFRLWILSLLTAHSALRRLPHVHSCTASIIAARSSICSGSSCSRQPQDHAAVVSLVQCACSAGSSSWCHLCSAGISSSGRQCSSSGRPEGPDATRPLQTPAKIYTTARPCFEVLAGTTRTRTSLGGKRGLEPVHRGRSRRRSARD